MSEEREVVVRSPEDFARAMRDARPGDVIRIGYAPAGATAPVLEAAEVPADVLAAVAFAHRDREKLMRSRIGRSFVAVAAAFSRMYRVHLRAEGGEA